VLPPSGGHSKLHYWRYIAGMTSAAAFAALA
jgi:hypothetical protein